MKASGAKIFFYFDLGQWENFRDYSQSGSAPAGSDPTLWGCGTTIPHGPVDPNWPGDYYVNYWDSSWQTLVLKYVDKAIALGYDGFYCDVVDSCQTSYATGNVPATNGQPAHSQNSAFEAMNNLLAAMKSHIASSSNPSFLIMANGSEEGFAYNSGYATNIDVFWKEECFYSNLPDFPSFQIDSGYMYTVGNINLARSVKPTLPIAVVEYVSGSTAINDVKTKCAAQNYGWYIAAPNGQLGGIDTDGF
jgi:uncharacterized protein (TIGR01370 family)